MGEESIVVFGALFSIVVVGFIGLVLIRPTAHKERATSYRKILHLMSPAERRFFDALREADADAHWLFAKVRLADLVATRKGLAPSDRQSAFNKIKAKHIDFVLCEPVTMKPVLAVELDDASHRAKSRRQRDAFVDEVTAAVGLPLLHVQARAGYDSAQLRDRIKRTLCAADKPEPALDERSTGSGADWLRSGGKPQRLAGNTQVHANAHK